MPIIPPRTVRHTHIYTHKHIHTHSMPKTCSWTYLWYQLYDHLCKPFEQSHYTLQLGVTLYTQLGFSTWTLLLWVHTILPRSSQWLTGNPVCECFVICNVSSICGLLRDFQFLLDNFFKSLQFFSESWAPDLEISCPWKQPLAGAFSCSFSTHPASNQAVLAYFLHLVDSMGNCQSFIIFPVGVGLVDLVWLFSNPFCPWMPEWSF